MAEGHLYRGGAKGRQKKKFEERYGKRKGDYVYGSVVGKVKREREAKHDPPRKADPPEMLKMSPAISELMGFEGHRKRMEKALGL